MTMTQEAMTAISSYGRVLSKALDERDSGTRRHCDRVIELAGSLGRACGLMSDELRLLRMCGLFHDIGKIGIPDRVLHKPGALEADEWDEMRSHPERGQRIVEAIGIDGTEDIALGVRHHHERYDGRGYPDGLSGEEIPHVARMVAVADAYDAMGIARPYHHGRTHEQIMAMLYEESGRKYDPHILDRFAAMIGDSRHRAPLT
jgi:putative nucleotidyltransferase with HDIG domain